MSLSLALFSAIFPPWLSTWLAPLWILGVGALTGLAILALIAGACYLISKATGWALWDEVSTGLREGVLGPLLVLAVILALISVIALPVVSNPQELLNSSGRLFATGVHNYQFTIDPADKGRAEKGRQEIPISFRRDELVSMKLESNMPLEVASEDEATIAKATLFEVADGAPFIYVRSEDTRNRFPKEEIDKLYVENLSEERATLKATVVTTPVHGEVAAIPITAILVVVVPLIYFLHRLLLPKLSAVALATTKSEIAQPIFLLLASVVSVMLVFSIWIPYNTFGEDIKMLKESGFSMILVACIIQAVWSASSSISEEVEGRTALTVMSKPLGRWQFVLGKFLGIIWTITILLSIYSLVFLAVVAFKPIYDAGEGAKLAPTWKACFFEVGRSVPGLALVWMEAVVMAAISVAVSTRLPRLANFMISATVYVLGHLTPLIVKTSLGDFEPVQVMGFLIATIFPVLDHFNNQAAITGGVLVPLEYLAWTLLYCVMYSTFAMLLALTLFETRDLA